MVLIPIRSFEDAKSRLSDILSADERKGLAITMAEVVVTAAGDLPVRVVTDDSDVAEWAHSVGVTPIGVGCVGLSESVQAAVHIARSAGFERVIVAHADLPAACDLTIVRGSGMAIAPDRRRDGSNVLSVPTGAGFRFSYGPNSFDTHLAEAARLGLAVEVIDAPDLAWDVDEPDDLPDDWADLIARGQDRPRKAHSAHSPHSQRAGRNAS